MTGVLNPLLRTPYNQAFKEKRDLASYLTIYFLSESPIFHLYVACGKIIKVLMQDNKDAAAQVLGAEVKSISHSEEPLPENNIKQKDSPMEDFNFDGRKQMDEQRHSPEPEKRTR